MKLCLYFWWSVVLLGVSLMKSTHDFSILSKTFVQKPTYTCFSKSKSSLGVWLNLERYILHLFHTVVNEVSSFEKKLGAVLWLASPFRKNFWSARALELKVKTMECFCFSECLCFRCECPLVWRSSLLSPSWVAFEAPVFSPATAPEVEPPSQNREWAGSSYLSAAITGSLAWVTGSLTGSREQVEDATPALCGRRRPARGWGESVPLLLVPSVWYGVSVSLSRGTSVRLFSDTADSHCSHWILADFLR